jgi:hypothetical protein
MIIWKLDLQLPIQSLPITTKVVNSNPVHGDITTICDKACQWLVTGRWFSPVSSTNKTDRHDIAEILLQVELINQTKPIFSVRNECWLDSPRPVKFLLDQSLKWIFEFIGPNQILEFIFILF